MSHRIDSQASWTSWPGSMSGSTRRASHRSSSCRLEDKFPEITAQREELKLKRLAERVKQLEQDTKLRGPYAWTILVATGVQIIVADVVFVLYATNGVHWVIPPAAISAWLGAVVIQVIGVVLVVTRYLFPGKGSPDPED